MNTKSINAINYIREEGRSNSNNLSRQRKTKNQLIIFKKRKEKKNLM